MRTFTRRRIGSGTGEGQALKLGSCIEESGESRDVLLWATWTRGAVRNNYGVLSGKETKVHDDEHGEG